GAGLIAGGAWAPASLASRALGHPALRWVGRLSFAWYLWHWPLVGLGAVLDPGIGVGGKLAWSAGALGLAWLTHWFVEGSMRAGWRARVRPEWLPGGALAASLAALLVAQGAVAAADRAAAAPAQRALAAAREDRVRHECWGTTVDAPVGRCEFGD